MNSLDDECGRIASQVNKSTALESEAHSHLTPNFRRGQEKSEK